MIMKFSVEIETESHLFDQLPEPIKEKPSLHWDIQVEVQQKKKAVSDTVDSPAQRTSTASRTATTVTETRKPSTRKISSTSELIEKMGRGRKVNSLVAEYK